MITAFGVLMVAAFTAAYLTALPRFRVLGLGERTLIDIALVSLIAGMVGARARYVWERPGEFHTGSGLSWGEWLAHAADFNSGGMVWYGGVLFAAVGVWLLLRLRRVAVLPVTDALLPSLLIGLGIGRIGCFFNGCCFGIPCSLPWAVMGPHGVPVHPTQLYETAACTLLGGALWWWWRRRSSDGQVTVLAVVGYAIWRFINEGLRDHGPLVEQNLLGWHATTSQLTSIWLGAAILVGASVEGWRRYLDPVRAAAARRVPGSIHAPPATTTPAD